MSVSSIYNSGCRFLKSLVQKARSSLLHSVNLIVFTLLLVHLILRISPHHSHHLRFHHLSVVSLSLQT